MTVSVPFENFAYKYEVMENSKLDNLTVISAQLHIEARYTWNGNEWIWNEDSEVDEDIQESSGDYQNDDDQ